MSWRTWLEQPSCGEATGLETSSPLTSILSHPVLSSTKDIFSKIALQLITLPWHPSTTQSRDLLLLTALGFAERSSWGNIPIFGELRQQVSAFAQHLCRGGAAQCQSGHGAKTAAWPPTYPALRSRRQLWDSKRKPWVNRAKYQLSRCTLQPPTALRAVPGSESFWRSPGALLCPGREMLGQPGPRQSSPCMWRGQCPHWTSQPVALFSLHQTHSCGKPQGTWAFNRAILTTPLVQAGAGVAPCVIHMESYPWLRVSYRQWSELPGFPSCPHSCDLAWNLTCPRQLLWSFQLFMSKVLTWRFIFPMLFLYIEPNHSLFLISLTSFSHLFPFASSNRFFSLFCATEGVWSWLTAAWCLFACYCH